MSNTLSIQIKFSIKLDGLRLTNEEKVRAQNEPQIVKTNSKQDKSIILHIDGSELLINQNWLTPQIILTAYAACISTIALVWNIIIAVLEKCSRLRVTSEFREAMTASMEGKIIKGPTTLFVRTVNKGNKIKYIYNIAICLPYRTSTGNLFSLVNFDTKFPIELLPQQEIVYKFKFINNPKLMLENFCEGKCYVIVFDTIRKKYKSNKFNTSNVKKAFEHNSSLSPEIRALFNQ